MNLSTVVETPSLGARVATRFAPPQLQMLEHWQVIRHLGSGSSGHVWLLRHESGTKYAACKAPHSKENASMLSQEAELAASLSHENLVAYIEPAANELPEFGQAGGVSFWEYLPAGSLAHLVATGGKLSIAQTVTILLPMVQVMEYLTSRQVVHGDISPHNILFDLTGRPVLIDLGAARATAHSYTLTGTPGFVAPELASTTHDVAGLHEAADVFSLAAVGWFCLTGMAPGPPHRRVPLITLNDELDPDIIQFLESALSEEPTLRPSLEQFANSVQHWADPEPVDLYAAVGEEYGLLLPTRKPSTSKNRSRRMFGSFWHKRRLKTKSRGSNNASTSRRRLLFSGMCLGLLAAAVLGTGLSVSEKLRIDPAPRVTSQISNDELSQFQQVLDNIARRRTAAWTTPDATQVEEYALVDSDIFRQDTAILEALESTEHTLDDLQMRAVVESVDYNDAEALVTVQWYIDAYVQRNEVGEVIEEFEQTNDQLQLSLEESDGGWKIATATAA